MNITRSITIRLRGAVNRLTKPHGEKGGGKVVLCQSMDHEPSFSQKNGTAMSAAFTANRLAPHGAKE